jgi:uncharacterized protein YciI
MNRVLLLIGLLCSFAVSAQEYTHSFVFLNSKPDKEVISEEASEELQKQHMQSIGQLVEQGKMIVAGPFDGGGGIFILNTPDVKLAKEWLSNDPAIRANRWNVEVLPIQFNKGGACQTAPPYEMVTYGFTRVNYINDIANYKMNNSANSIWKRSMRQDSVIMSGTFPQFDGGVIIYYESSDQSWMTEYSIDQLKFEKKKLWVARGSFCE